MSQLKSEGRGNLAIGQKVIDFIKSKRFLFSNRLPDLGERWTIKSEHFNSYEKRLYVCIENERGDWMRLPKDLF